jgi:cysteine desulfurase
VYLDYNATAPVAPRVLTAMMPYFARQYGNASSAHIYGHEAHEALDLARRRVARLLSCFEDEVVFTGGGSESNNLAIKGLVMRHAANRTAGKHHIIASVVDHPSVLKTCYYLAQREGARVTLVPVDRHGLVDPGDVGKALTPDTVLVSIMLANNEVGTIQPVREIVDAVREAAPYAIVHSDAAQATGKIPIDVRALGVDMLTIAGHKFCGPKGVGVLFVRRGLELDPLIEGAGHENGRRSGTENIPGIVGLGMAAKLARESLAEEEQRLRSLRDRLQEGLLAEAPAAVVNGHPTARLPNTLNISLPGLIGADILKAAPRVAASTGAACHSDSVDPSSVLVSMGIPSEIALGAIRLSLGRYTTEPQIDEAIEALNTAVAGLAQARALRQAS